MDNKIFLGKYRVSAEEISAVGELTDSPLAYEGEEIDSGTKVVVEAIPAASLKLAVREQLEAEAMAAKKLNHANIPALYDFGVEDDRLVYVTEDFEGTLAEEWVNAHGPMPVGPVLRIAAQVVSALGAAAFHRISHHAINPSNLVLVPGQTAEGEWPLTKVLHFVGVVPKFSGTGVSVAAFDKALHYASPEQLQHGGVDFRSEIYSLGCTMWFLLTGAPPLTTPSGPMAEPLTQTGLAQTGLALDKISGLPKKIRRLLAQMLSIDPDARPHDPLAFYRELQDCLAQVERRETLSRKFGVPVISTTGAVVSTRRRRSPMKALALAALLLALAAVTALVLQGYLRHRRVVRAEEPIGVPIGVPDAFASATPISANAPNAIASNTTPPTTTVANANSTQSVPAERTAPEKPVAADSVESTEASQIALAPVAPATPAAEVNPPTQEPAPVVANNASILPAATDSSQIVDNAKTPPAPTNSSAVAAISKVEAAPAESPGAEAVAQESEKIVMREVRRGELVEEPEVRRAEPLPPEEGPDEVVPNTSRASEEQAKAVQPEENGKGPADAPESTTLILKRTDSKPKVAKPPEKKTRQTTKSKRRSDQRTHPSQPMASMRARFVGVTEDGRWMFVLPSNKIIIVPPPPSYP